MAKYLSPEWIDEGRTLAQAQPERPGATARMQVDGTTRRHHEGAGLGLPIAKALAHSMGCALTVDSKPGVGTRFEVEFPR